MIILGHVKQNTWEGGGEGGDGELSKQLIDQMKTHPAEFAFPSLSLH